jgi:hypothetical protein
LPLARASVRQEFLRRSRRLRDQVGQETSRLRDQFQQVGDRVEDKLEGWLEEPPWQEGERGRGEPQGPFSYGPGGRWDPSEDQHPDEPADARGRATRSDPLEDWDDDAGAPWQTAPADAPVESSGPRRRSRPVESAIPRSRRPPRPGASAEPEEEGDPWV